MYSDVEVTALIFWPLQHDLEGRLLCSAGSTKATVGRV